MRSGTPFLMNFDTRLRFGCNGSIDIFVEAVGENFLAELAALRVLESMRFYFLATCGRHCQE